MFLELPQYKSILTYIEMKHTKKIPLKRPPLLRRFLAFSILLPVVALWPVAGQSAESAASKLSLQTTPKMRKETQFLVFCMENGHYLKTALSDLDVREFIRGYMENIDAFKLFFTANDVQHYQDFFSPSIEIMLRQGALLPAFSIYSRFMERAESRLEWIKKRMDQPFDLDGRDTFRPDRRKENWPADAAAADKLWNDRLRFDIINQMLGYEAELDEDGDEFADAGGKIPDGGDKKTPKTFEEKYASAKAEVLKRYTRLIDGYIKAEPMEIQEIYLNTLSHFYDPHSAFLSEYYLEEFDISVRNALVGIGALLADREGYCVLEELMPGGPAEDCKQLKPGDKILGVGQDGDKIVDVVGMKLRNTVRLIRGRENTRVRLLVEPASNPSSRKIVTLVRKQIKLTTKLARAEVYTIPVDNKTVPVGVIDLPAFYGESSGEDGEAKGFSTSKDVEELLNKLKKFGVKGIILDLRRNGGGFLNESVDFAGLFIKTGPVVQVRSATGATNRLSDDDPRLVWSGPLMVMVSRLSASASEIVAGALQNHKRAIVVGDKSTHGKGTVQAVLNLSNFDPSQKSAAKVTVQKWYAPSGESIQLKGVHSDIVLPSVYDYMEIGEQYKDYAMKWDSIFPAEIDSSWEYGVSADKAGPLLSKLTERSLERQKGLEEFKLWNERINWIRDRQNMKDWSLNYKAREALLKADEKFTDNIEKREKELAKNYDYHKTEVLLDSAKKDAEHDAETKRRPLKKSPKHGVDADDTEDDGLVFDVQMREALRIMGDWINITEHPELLASAKVRPRKDN